MINTVEDYFGKSEDGKVFYRKIQKAKKKLNKCVLENILHAKSILHSINKPKP